MCLREFELKVDLPIGFSRTFRGRTLERILTIPTFLQKLIQEGSQVRYP